MDQMFWLAGITLLAATINGALGYGFSSITVPLALLFQAENLQAYAAMISELNTNSDEDLDELQDFMNELEAI